MTSAAGDLKPALAAAINAILQPVRDHFASDPKAKELLKKVKVRMHILLTPSDVGCCRALVSIGRLQTQAVFSRDVLGWQCVHPAVCRATR